MKRGLEINNAGSHHPGAIQMAFNSRISYAQVRDNYSIVSVHVSIKAKIILPYWHWQKNSSAQQDVRLI